MPAMCVQVRHDDHRWYEAELLDQHRTDGRWRAVVRYSVAPGRQYMRAEWADDLRPASADVKTSARYRHLPCLSAVSDGGDSCP